MSGTFRRCHGLNDSTAESVPWAAKSARQGLGNSSFLQGEPGEPWLLSGELGYQVIKKYIVLRSWNDDDGPSWTFW